MFKSLIKKEKPFQPSNFKRNFRYIAFITVSFCVIVFLILYLIPSEQNEIEGKVISSSFTSNHEGNHIKIVVQLNNGKNVTIEAPFNIEIKKTLKSY